MSEFLNVDHSETDDYFTQNQKMLLHSFITSLHAKKDFTKDKSADQKKPERKQTNDTQ